MTAAITTSALRALPACAGMDNLQLLRLIEIAPPRFFEAGWPIYEEGSRGRSCLLITAGEVTASKRVGKRDHTIATLHAGVMLGQGALIDRSKRMITLTAVTDTTALVIDRDDYRGLLARLDPLALHLQRQVAIAGIRQLRAVTLAVSRVAVRLDRLKDPNRAFIDSRDAALRTQAALDEWSLDVQRLLQE